MQRESPLPRNVFLLGDGMLFDDIIVQMLTSVTNLRVIKRVYEGEAAFFDDLNGCRPDVILLTETDRFNCEQLMALLSRTSLLVDLRIIVLSIKHNNVQILDRLAGWDNTRASVLHTLPGMDDWNELLDLVIGENRPRMG